ncbi:MAG: AmmeMemoRadiSam system radical SAM enzyme [archaeon]
MKEAKFYKKLKNKIVQCQLCPHFCMIKDNNLGKCKVRKNINGKIYSLSYGKPVSINLDPITKKPLFHFLKNTLTFSIGMAGCNMSCLFCQNWEISQKSAEEFDVKNILPKELVDEVLKSGCPSISYTYSEPLVSFEYVFGIAKLAHKKGLKNILVTNGFVNPEPLKKIIPFIDAMNIDLKSFSDSTYRKFCGAKLQPVLETIKMAHKAGIHLEITTLVIPGINDSEEEIKQIAKFIASIDVNIPWHISRFFPKYKMKDKAFTSKQSLEKAYEIGKNAGLKYVHLGNI